MKNEPRYITAYGKARLERDLLELETAKLSNLVELVPEALTRLHFSAARQWALCGCGRCRASI